MEASRNINIPSYPDCCYTREFIGYFRTRWIRARIAFLNQTTTWNNNIFSLKWKEICIFKGIIWERIACILKYFRNKNWYSENSRYNKWLKYIKYWLDEFCCLKTNFQLQLRCFETLAILSDLLDMIWDLCETHMLLEWHLIARWNIFSFSGGPKPTYSDRSDGLIDLYNTGI